MILASGVAKVPQMLRAGVNVALATDGPASNHNQDMIGVLKTTALIQSHDIGSLGHAGRKGSRNGDSRWRKGFGA